MAQNNKTLNKDKEKTDTEIYQKNTFAVRILYRCNTSWQGEVKWLEGRRKKRFRSLLELIMLIQEALPDK